MRLLPIFFVAALATAGAQSPTSAPKPATTASRATSDSAKFATYDLEVTTDDGTLTGVLVVKPAANGLAADLQVGPNKPDVKSFAREGDHYVLTGGHGTFTLRYDLKFWGDSVSGAFKLSGGLSGTVIGAVRR